MMLALLLLFAVVPNHQTLGARSAHHELRLERNALSAEQVAYEVTVVNLDSGKAVLDAHLTGKPGEALDAANKDGSVRVRLAYSAHFFSATVNVLDGKTIADEFRTWWQLEAPQPSSAASASAPYRAGGDVKAPVITYRVEPKYTDEARAKHISGIVILEVIVDKTGRVAEARVLKPLPFGLDQAAVDAVKQWQFKPGTLGGIPVDVLLNVTVNFMLDAPKENS